MPEWVVLGRVQRARGNRGEVAVDSFTRGPERFLEVGAVHLVLPEGEELGEFQVEEAWEHRGQAILKFKGVDTISAADALKGSDITIPESQRITLGPDEYFIDDLAGCQVVEGSNEKQYGRVTAFLEQPGGTGLLEVEGELLIPLAKSICYEINIAERLIRVRLPEGLAP
ncbi:MAG: 16S rRNA processing protein RimM [Acidobacteria bacterium]|nr:16S rRNA processing protein RimM [Acidobacteriota bacterium]